MAVRPLIAMEDDEAAEDTRGSNRRDDTSGQRYAGNQFIIGHGTIGGRLASASSWLAQPPCGVLKIEDKRATRQESRQD